MDELDVIRRLGSDATDPDWAVAARRALEDVIAGGRAESPGRHRRGVPVAAVCGVLALGLGLAALLVTGPGSEPAQEATTRSELPRGGTRILQDVRVVAYSCAPGGTLLGVLGGGPPDQVGHELEATAAGYGSVDRPVLPAFELIATNVTDTPGSDGLYRTRLSDAQIQEYLDAARRRRMLLILDIQPGRAAFMDEVRHYERWLREPDVSLALEPEWSMGPSQIPGQVIGRTDGETIDAVSAYLGDLVARNGLPEKLLLVHQFTESMIVDPATIAPRSGVALVWSVDGFGTPEAKTGKYVDLTNDPRRPAFAFNGFKVFFEEDQRGGNRVMTPAEVLALDPQPDVVVYE